MIENLNPQALMVGPLGDWLDEQRDMRAQARARTNRRAWNAAIVLLPLIAAGLILVQIELMAKVVVSVFIGVLAWIWIQQPVAKARKAMKVGINEAIAGSLGLTYSHDFDPGEHFERAKGFGLVPSYDRSVFEDLWQGQFDGQPFLLHEAKLEEQRGSGKNRRYVTVFKGAIIAIGFSRDFHGTTLLQRASKHRGFFGGRKDTIKLNGVTLDHVDLVHPEFGDAFAAWSSDQVEARYLIHPAYVERLIAIENAFSGKNIRTLFHAGEVLVAIESGNMFESGSIDPDKDHELIAKTCEQFSSLAGLARSLDEAAR
ncbi:DUF3137 domain-containing protein [Croceicoccus sediminis]|uniref:DUF3137 domain-containing protein n=1 Tax=Croceicoccus sediminis TaxID=2571150 RepID=UPI00118271E4|nr:DUF3137 domain-containing protein [Croceicoccus sediminis]